MKEKKDISTFFFLVIKDISTFAYTEVKTKGWALFWWWLLRFVSFGGSGRNIICNDKHSMDETQNASYG